MEGCFSKIRQESCNIICAIKEWCSNMQQYWARERGETVIQLMIIADDFTGALDTGVQFAAWGAVVRVVTNGWDRYDSLDPSVQVLVMDAETRHLSDQEAYQTVYGIARNAKEHRIPYIYKKTDSALRGNIGSELQALKDAAGVKILPFVPAFPQMGRITRHGIHFVNGKPVRESVFGKDPFEPVECSYVPDIIHRQTDTEVVVVEKEWEAALLKEDMDAIVVFDADDYEDILATAKKLNRMGIMEVMAGCAGFAASLPQLLDLVGEAPGKPEFEPGLLVVCGSVNPITQRQLDTAQKAGFTRIRLTPEQKLSDSYWNSPEGLECLEKIYETCRNQEFCMIDTNDEPGTYETNSYARANGLTLEEMRRSIADTLGRLLTVLSGRDIRRTMLITGGDTLLGFLNHMGICEMEPVCEMETGIVLSRFYNSDTTCQVISKSGGFGDDGLLIRLAETIGKGRSCYADSV